jgi:hypothetical protein
MSALNLVRHRRLNSVERWERMLDAQAYLSTQAFILMYWLSGLRRYNRAVSPTELP